MLQNGFLTVCTQTKRNAKNLKLSSSKLKQLFFVRYTHYINDSLAREHCNVLNNEEWRVFMIFSKIANETCSYGFHLSATTGWNAILCSLATFFRSILPVKQTTTGLINVVWLHSLYSKTDLRRNPYGVPFLTDVCFTQRSLQFASLRSKSQDRNP